MIASVFSKAKTDNRKVFIPYFPAGYPTLAKSKKVFVQLAKSGSDLIEVGIPFSDAIADGPVIQKAATSALQAGLRVNQVFDALSELNSKLPPTIIMTYYNLLYANGLKNFARKAGKTGVRGVIVPDLPPDEAGDWIKASRDHLETVFLVAPTTTDERIKKIDKATSAFIYCVSLTGVTGARKQLPPGLQAFLKRVRKITKKPLAVGFGISSKQHVEQLQPHADGIIIGSAIIEAYNKGKTEKEALQLIDKLVNNLQI